MVAICVRTTSADTKLSRITDSVRFLCKFDQSARVPICDFLFELIQRRLRADFRAREKLESDFPFSLTSVLYPHDGNGFLPQSIPYVNATAHHLYTREIAF